MNKNECGKILRKLVAVAQTRNPGYLPSVVVERELDTVKNCRWAGGGGGGNLWSWAMYRQE